MFAIEVLFLTGRYVATAYDSRRESEWPPHPARLFSALVATHGASSDEMLRASERAALEWLERLPPPALRASDASRREVVTVFVPVNDVALTNVDEEAEAVAEIEAALAAAEQAGDRKGVRRHSKRRDKAAAALKKAIASAIEVPARSTDSRHGQRVLPEHRTRQPRAFPSVTPDDPRVAYVWESVDASPDVRQALDNLLRRVVRLGHSSSFVSVRVVDSPAAPNWRPAPGGDQMLRVVQPGQLAALERAFERHRGIEPRVMPFMPGMYSSHTTPDAVVHHRSMLAEDWVVLRRVGGPVVPMTAAVGVARALRNVLMSFADQPPREILSGHKPDGASARGGHLAIVPLPFIGHAHASGLILGIALIFPRRATADDRRAIFRALNAWEAIHRLEDEDTPAVPLNLGGAGQLLLERVEWSTPQSSLIPGTWTRPSRVWLSATPVALDRNPGDLGAGDPGKASAAINEAAESVALACERIDLPRPIAVEILPAAPWAGAAKARRYPPYPGESSRPQRVLTHARIEFSAEVAGPVVLGAGRFVGLGLFRPASDR